jgi:hypothetical protein
MKKDLTDITVVLDRSGSMGACREEAENGLNNFVAEQQKLTGECNFSLMQFDTEYEVVHNGIPLDEVPKFTLMPRGMTALLDAVGRAINEVGERLSALPERDRPELVVFVIVTDGLENASHECTRDQIRQMIEHQQAKHQWKFSFLGANQDAFAEAGALGISAAATSNFDVHASDEAFRAAAFVVKRSRVATQMGMKADLAFTDEERSSMANKS